MERQGGIDDKDPMKPEDDSKKPEDDSKKPDQPKPVESAPVESEPVESDIPKPDEIIEPVTSSCAINDTLSEGEILHRLPMEDSSKARLTCKTWFKTLVESSSCAINDTLFENEILHRLPMEDLSKARLTCKTWFKTLVDSSFILKHLKFSKERFLHIEHDVSLINPFDPSVKSAPLPHFLTYGREHTLIHCDGLFLMHSLFQGQSYLYLWNPFLGDASQIFPSDSIFSFQHFGIGYRKFPANTPRNYTILGFSGKDEGSVEILDLETCVWKKLKAKLDWLVHPSCRGLSIGGNMYWLTYSNTIQLFSFTTEEFKKLGELVFVDDEQIQQVSLSSHKGNRLSLLLQGLTGDIAFWVSSPLDDQIVSWTCLLNVSDPSIPSLGGNWDCSPHFLEKNDTIVLLSREKEEVEDLVEYWVGDEEVSKAYISLLEINKEGVLDRVRVVETSFLHPFFLGYVYTPSLVRVPELPYRPSDFRSGCSRPLKIS